MIYAFVGAGLYALVLILQKFVLSNLKVEYKVFNALIFLVLAASALVWSIFNHSLPSKSFFSPLILFLLFVLMLVVVLWNSLFSSALQKESMPEAELIIMLQPLLTILLALAIFPQERNWLLVIPAVVAAGILIWANFKKHHLDFDRQEIILLFAVVLMAVDTILVKGILSLTGIAGESLYFIRCFLALIPLSLLTLNVRPWPKLSFKSLILILLSGLVAVAGIVFFYRAYVLIGVTQTVLISLLAPVLVFLLSAYLLKEKIAWKLWVALAVISICIVIVQLKII
jgi:drug/metabolite transporter (DMT)-like permease